MMRQVSVAASSVISTNDRLTIRALKCIKQCIYVSFEIFHLKLISHSADPKRRISHARFNLNLISAPNELALSKAFLAFFKRALYIFLMHDIPLLRNFIKIGRFHFCKFSD
jgi:hypothetical protein